MSSREPRTRHIPRTSVPLPVPKETPTLRLGSMLQTVRERSRKLEANDSPPAFCEPGPASLSTEPIHRAIKGNVLIDGKPESVASFLWRQVAGVLIRESGF